MGWVWAQRPDPKWISEWILPCPNPRGLWDGSVAGPNRVGGLGSCPDPRGFGSLRVRTQEGLGLGPSESKPNMGWVGVWVWTQGGLSLGPSLFGPQISWGGVDVRT